MDRQSVLSAMPPSTAQGTENVSGAGAQLRIRPLPWSLGENGGIYDSEGRLVLSDSDDDVEATIVHCVNAHAALVKALQDLITRYELDGVPNDSRPFVAAARAALAGAA